MSQCIRCGLEVSTGICAEPPFIFHTNPEQCVADLRRQLAEVKAERDKLIAQQHADFVRLSKLVFPFDKTHPATDTSAIMMNVELLAECGDCDERASYRYCEKCAPEEDTVVEAIAKWLETQFVPHGVILRLLDGQWRRP